MALSEKSTRTHDHPDRAPQRCPLGRRIADAGQRGAELLRWDDDAVVEAEPAGCTGHAEEGEQRAPGPAAHPLDVGEKSITELRAGSYEAGVGAGVRVVCGLVGGHAASS
jgi:hypothetical protein